jgi:phosphoglucomutase
MSGLNDAAPKVSASAGEPVPAELLVNVPKLIAAYYAQVPDASVPEQRVAFGTSGHRGSAFAKSFNEAHVLAITQAICHYRKKQHIDGPLFLGVDTHALSAPAFSSALEVLAGNGAVVMIAKQNEYTPTPAISHAILVYNRARDSGLADGIVVTPSHNPPDQGGFKYNPPHGGPADSGVTRWIERQANELLKDHLRGVKRIPCERRFVFPQRTNTIF